MKIKNKKLLLISSVIAIPILAISFLTSCSNATSTPPINQPQPPKQPITPPKQPITPPKQPITPPKEKKVIYVTSFNRAPKEITQKEFELLNNGTDSEKITILSNFFAGDIKNNFNNFTITIKNTGSTIYALSLKSKEGYVFKSGKTDIESNSFEVEYSPVEKPIILNIRRKKEVTSIAKRDVLILNGGPAKNHDHYITILNKYFSGPIAENMEHINIRVDSKTPINWNVVLTSNKPNYAFVDVDSNQLNSSNLTISISPSPLPSPEAGPQIAESEAQNYFNTNKSFSLMPDVVLVNNDSFEMLGPVFNFANKFPRLTDSSKTFLFFDSSNGKNSKSFRIKIIPKNIIDNWPEIHKIPFLKDNTSGENLTIEINGFYSPSEMSNILDKTYTSELNSIIDNLNVNGLVTNQLCKNTFITPNNHSTYDLNQYVDFKYLKSTIDPENSFLYNFNNIAINEKLGTVNFNLKIIIKDSKKYLLGDSSGSNKVIFESKMSKNFSIEMKPNQNFANNYNEQMQKVSIDEVALNQMINTITKGQKQNYFAHKISRNDLLKSIKNYDSKPNNVFLDYDANGDLGTLEVKLIKRNFGYDKFTESQLVLSAGSKITEFNRNINNQIKPETIDNILQSIKISGFKKFNDISSRDKQGFTTFKSWYAFKRSFSVGIGNVDITGQGFNKDSAGNWDKNPTSNGEYKLRFEEQIGTGWIAHKFSDQEFLLATNTHVAEGLKQANNNTGKWVRETETNYNKLKWLYNNYDFDYQNNLSFRQTPPKDIPKQLLNCEFFSGIKVQNGKIIEHIYDYPKYKNYYDSTDFFKQDLGLLNRFENIEYIKLDNVFGKKYIKTNDQRSLILEKPMQATISNNYSDNINEENYSVALDLVYFRIKFKTAENAINKIWEEIGPTSFTPVDNFVMTNSGSYENFLGQTKLKSWNNFSTGGYPWKDEGENPEAKNYKYVYKGDGGFDQQDQNDYLKSIFTLNLANTDYANNNLDIKMLQNNNEEAAGGASGSPIFDKNMNVIAILSRGGQKWWLPDEAITFSGEALMTDINLDFFGNRPAVAQSSQSLRYLIGYTNYNVIKKWMK